MSTIILHDKKNNNWNSLGIGPLQDAINPLSTRERNGIYDMTFQYPVVGKLFHELKVGRWIVADAGPTLIAKSQRFEIAQITKPIKGIVTVYCEHYRYKLLRTMVKIGSKYSNISAQTALNQLRSQMEPKSDFTFYSDVGTTSSIDFTDPAKYKNAQEVLGGVAGSILDNFGGEYLFNNNQVRLLAKAGTDTNVVIAYGKNLTDINQEESIENTYTSIYGWAKIGNGDDEKVITLPEIYIDSDYVSNYTERRIQMVDFSDKEPKDVEALRGMVKSFIKSNNVGIPRVSIKASYVDLASSVSDEQLKSLEVVDLCDWVTVAFNQLNINTTAQIVKTVWNISLDRYESIELGEARTDFAKVIEDSKTDTEDMKDKIDWLEQAQKEASDIIRNPGKGHVLIYPSISDPQELLIIDTLNINTAREVWRWNAGGLGFSKTGYNGTYELAFTKDGSIVADRVNVGTLRAINLISVSISGATIEGGVITSRGKDFSLKQDNGAITWTRNSDGKEIFKFYTTLMNQKEGNVRLDISDEGSFTIFNKKLNKAFLTFFGATNNMSGSANLDNFYVIGSGHSLNFAPGSFGYSSTASKSPSLNVSSSGFSIGNNDTKVLGSSGGRISISATSTSVTGNLSVTGSKNSLVETLSYGHRLLNAYETPEYYFADYGKAITDSNGEVRIDIDPIFLETVNTKSENYHVMLSPYSKGIIWVEETKEKYFKVKSEPALLEFSWNLVAYRKGYEDVRLTQQEGEDYKEWQTKF
ncbi:phage tail spike protein [Enterococcus faecalis]|uniref:phage tail spike protein n=1 Tax=Enterococcus faecalis TaxID=1351 RepID=UPI0001F0D02E|nr:phage tail spike protein [Enterococcus faecalis]EFT93916.1 phage minor structural protein, N-terminal domain protein [Enterococcus faecalis TX0012]